MCETVGGLQHPAYTRIYIILLTVTELTSRRARALPVDCCTKRLLTLNSPKDVPKHAYVAFSRLGSGFFA